jgi:L-fucose isomerase-like protein
MTFAILVANRGFFPSSVIAAARDEMRAAVEGIGAKALLIDPAMTRYGAVETRAEGEAFADFLKANEGQYDGLIICLPNFGDENGICDQEGQGSRVPGAV